MTPEWLWTLCNRAAKYQTMNRIRELREASRISSYELAERVGTTQSQISRLETGERRLTEDWMRRIARALNVAPSDLIATATMAEFNEDIEPYRHAERPESDIALQRLGLAFFRVTSDVVELAGIHAGRVILIDMRPAAVAAVRTGDIVVAQVYAKADLLTARTVVRQFVAPSLLTTNRRGNNMAIQMDGLDYEAAIKGVWIPDDTPLAA